jgi:hypothetical protein
MDLWEALLGSEDLRDESLLLRQSSENSAER